MELQPGPALPPGGLFEVVFSFDTTGSMSSVLDEVKGRLQDMIQRLQADIPGIRTGVIAHGDYCDREMFYVEKHLDLTTDIRQLCDFVGEIEGTGGGDPEECYELVLRMISRDISWTPGSQRALVLIGDSSPHDPDYELNENNIDWREEAEQMANMGVKVYGVQAFENDDGTRFFEELTEKTGGQHLKLGEFANVCDFIMAICYREKGEEFLDDYEAEVRARNRRMALHKDLEGMFGALRRGDSSASRSSAPGDLAKKPSLVSSLSSASAASGSRMAVVKPLPVVTAAKVPKTLKAKKVRRPPQQRTAPKKLRLAKPKTTKPGMLNRESVSDNNFILRQNNLDTRLSSWKLALTNQDPQNDKVWKKGSSGWRRRQLFPVTGKDKRVLYEVAVQATDKGKKHVLFCRWSRSSANPLTWEARLLGRKPGLRQLVDNVLKQNCKIYVRQFVVSRLGHHQQAALRKYRNMYDYAWSLHEDGNRRPLVRNHVHISS